jgi:hypothetical protein
MVRKTNRKAKKYPSEEWARIKIYGEEFNAALRHHVARSLIKAAHAAGLWTFCLCYGLIAAKGKAMRVETGGFPIYGACGDAVAWSWEIDFMPFRICRCL